MSQTPRLVEPVGKGIPFTIHPYSTDILYQLLKKHRSSSKDLTDDRARYFDKYLSDLGAKTILVEYRYTDADYLDDHAAYYVKCFRDYERHCNRLHFFSDVFSENEFLEIVEENPPEKLEAFRESYLGFVVVRPLPAASIGRTVLKTYCGDGDRRHYTCTRSYSSNLFGIAINLRSLAYQEQDAILAACATVSLWCCFNKTRELFGSRSPSPAEISASTNIMYSSRSTPSSGLNIQQMCGAIKHVGLEPELLPVKKETPLVSLIYSYVRMGIPLVLAVEIEGRGPHAITVVGYSLADKERSSAAVPMVGSKIDRFYCHDDQIGPFSRVWIHDGDDDNPVILKGSWRDRETNEALEIYPLAVVIPVYHKIRVTFFDVHKWLLTLHAVFRGLLKTTELEWDVYLTTTNEYKRELIELGIIKGKLLRRLLLEQQPRYIWRAIFKSKGQILVEFLIDATDIASAVPFFQAVWFDEKLRVELKTLSERADLQDAWVDMLKPRLSETIRHCAEGPVTLLNYKHGWEGLSWSE